MRCEVCGLRVRGKDHEKGYHHQAVVKGLRKKRLAGPKPRK